MRWRKQKRRDASPNFLFSTWPQVEEHNGIWQVVVSPSGGDDTPRMQAAVNRLYAIGGGTLRLTEGTFTPHEPIWIDA